jgi:hypothetical protein
MCTSRENLDMNEDPDRVTCRNEYALRCIVLIIFQAHHELNTMVQQHPTEMFMLAPTLQNCCQSHGYGIGIESDVVAKTRLARVLHICCNP